MNVQGMAIEAIHPIPAYCEAGRDDVGSRANERSKLQHRASLKLTTNTFVKTSASLLTPSPPSCLFPPTCFAPAYSCAAALFFADRTFSKGSSVPPLVRLRKEEGSLRVEEEEREAESGESGPSSSWRDGRSRIEGMGWRPSVFL